MAIEDSLERIILNYKNELASALVNYLQIQGYDISNTDDINDLMNQIIKQNLAPNSTLSEPTIVQSEKILDSETLCHLQQLIQNYQKQSRNLNEITPSELRVMNYVAEGMTNKQIGELLNCSIRTIEAHIYNIFKKLRFRNRVELACWVMSEKLKLSELGQAISPGIKS